MVARPRVDRVLLITLIFLVAAGLFIFLSASLGLLAYDSDSFKGAALSQIVLGLGGGLIACFFGVTIPYRFWRKYALYLFVGALIATLLVFVPHLGVTLNGAHRWIGIGPITFQPSEALKICYIIYLATLLSAGKNKIADFKHGFLPFAAVTGLAAVALLLQPDTDTFLVIAGSGLAMFFAAGAKLRDLAIILLVGILGIAIIATFRPYVMSRFTTFLHPGDDSQGSGYQIQQSLLAVGAGEIIGRGFGQSIQKFGKLPEPISDSIFSVYAEEFGFLGSAVLIIAYLTFAMRGLWVAARSPDVFGGLLAIGIVVLIAMQSFVNIGAMLGVLPLSGLPLVFISHGGSALLVALAASGILLSVSRSVRM
jgi:cell division protein FtsW